MLFISLLVVSVVNDQLFLLVIELHCEIKLYNDTDEVHVSDFLFGPVRNNAGMYVLECVLIL